MNNYKSIKEALNLIQNFCINEIEKERDLNNPEDYIIYKSLSDGISGIINIKSYIDFLIFDSNKTDDIPNDKLVFKKYKYINKTIN